MDKVNSVVDHNVGQPSPGDTQGAPVPSATTKPVESSEVAVAGELPEGVSERTQKEFEKLKNVNKQLKADLDASKPNDSVYDIFRAQPEVPVAPVQPVQPAPAGYVDQYGNVDAAKFNAAVASANARADEAARVANATAQKIQRSEENRQEKEAFAKHSYLNPKSADFDRNFYNLVKNQVVANYAGGVNGNLVDIADSISEFYKPVDTGAVAEGAVAEYKDTQAKKTASGSPKQTTRQTQTMTDEEIRDRSSLGDEDALALRLKKLGI